MLGVFRLNSQNIEINLNENNINLTELATRDLPFTDLKDGIKRARMFTINQVLQNNKNIAVQSLIKLELFSDKKYEAKIDRITTDINGTLSIRGRIIGYPMGYCIITTSSDNSSLLFVDIPELDECYITHSNLFAKSVYLLDIDKSKAALLEGDEPLTPPDELVFTQDFRPRQNFLELGINDPAIIDVMVLYTPAAKQWSANNDGGINNTITKIITQSNLLSDNSNIQVSFNLVHSVEVDYVESGSFSTDLNRLTYSDDGYMDEIHEVRDQYGADLVALLEANGDAGGLAWRLNSTSGRSEYAFSITLIRQSVTSYSAIHEMGHNMGLGHHKQQSVSPGPGLFPYSAGWRWKGTNERMYCSVMTYNSGSYFPDGISATRTPYFSNPNINYMGYPTGHPTEGDAARSIREMKHIIAAYRGPEVCLIPTGLSTSDITYNSAKLSWNPVYGAQSYTIRYKGWNYIDWFERTVVGNSYDVTDLWHANEEYYWKIRSNCSATSSSDFSPNVTFYTQPLGRSVLNTGIDNINSETEQLYPNPVTDMLYINNPIGEGEVQFIITDSTGRIVKKNNTKSGNITTIDVSDLPPSVYFLSIFDKTYQFIKK